MDLHILSITAGRAVSPMNIPEIFEHILTYLDDYTINHKVIFVSHKWLSLCRHRINREVTWGANNSSEDDTDVLRRFREASRINCFLCEGVQYTDKWEALCEAFRNRYGVFLERLEQKKHIYQSLMDLPLRELRIHGFADLTIPRLLPYISSITSLHVHFICDGIIDMGLLLENCPYLEQISLQSNALLTLPGPWILGEKVLRKRSLLPLRRFDLRGVQLPQSCLESLLMVTPYIRQLVIHISRPTMSGVYAFDESRLANFAKQHCQNLESFHCSNRENSSMIIEFLKPCSTSLHLERIVHVFRGVEIGRRHIQSPQPRSELLTKIEILISCPSICRYLSALPNLIYLKAPQTNIPWKEVDVHLRQLHGRVASGFPQLWACRNLQTLHIGMETYESSLVAARTIFGYISTLCPKLRDLEITKIDYCKPYPSNHRPEPLWPTLESGFCLLGRLKYLERLRVGNINVNIKLPCWHWDWIILSPDTKIEAAKHHKRLKVIKTWKSMLEEEARRDRLRLQNMCFLEGIQDPTAHLDGDNQIKAQLSHLGLLRDVVIFLENMHRNDNVEEEGCLKRWPRLQRLSVYHAAPFGQSTEKEVERLILAGAVDMSVELSAILSRHSYALIAFMSIAVLAAVLDLPLQSLFFFIFYFFIPKENKTDAE